MTLNPIPTRPVPAPATVQMRLDAPVFVWPEGGDDLERASAFCRAARIEMDAMLHAGRDDTLSDQEGRDPEWLSERLTAIQRGAKRSRARAIYRCAQDVLFAVQGRHAHMPIDWALVDGRLVVLNKLLGQYQDGLAEVAEQLSDEAQQSCLSDHAEDSPADVLQSLLPHASDDEREALQRLIDLSHPASTERPPAEADPVEPLFSVEDGLPDLVQELLAEGRDYGKMLSVSYAMENLVLSEDKREDLLSRLHKALSPLVASALPLQGVGHLDIAVEEDSLVISGSGFGAFNIPISVDKTEAPAPVQRFMITEETEASLRAQLGALLDGNDLGSEAGATES